MKSVGILGCGPAGMMVAHAALMSGWDFHIYSKKRKSQLFGAQYLHQPIPDLPHPGPKRVSYRLNGTPEEYRRKVYGDAWDGTVSPEDYLEEHYAWDLRHAYDEMWWRYGDCISDVNFHEDWHTDWRNDVPLDAHDLVISTVPRTVWDSDPNHFEYQRIWAIGDGDHERVHLHRPHPFSVVCDGGFDNSWYRVSNIYGYCTMEWPYTAGSPANGASIVRKPLRHTSTAASDFIHMGRYGAWQKGVLTHDVYFEAMKVFADDKL